jgi:phosphate transport system permease protein
MTEIAQPTSVSGVTIRPRRLSPEDSAARTRRRYAAERRFRAIGLSGIVIALGLLAVLLTTIVAQGYSAFVQTTVRLNIDFDPQVIDPDGSKDPSVLRGANYAALVRQSLFKMFPDVGDRREQRALLGLVSSGAPLQLQQMVLSDPALIGTTQEVWLLASDDVDQFVKGFIDRDTTQADRRVKDNEIGWIDQLEAQGRVEEQFNRWFFTNGDSREPELAGIWGAVVGSLYMMLVTLLLSVPLGVCAAIYLEEFAPKNSRWVDLIEVNVNNLAAVPSIVFGLLGLAVFLQLFGLPRSAPLVGGLTLTLMTLPTIVVATRAALRAVPPSIREAGLGIGASSIQVVSHHVLPLALPGILTGTIIGMAQALGETAPLLMIGMVAFIVDVPQGPLDPATALPVQIFLWADSPERAFTERTAAAIMVLLGFLIVMNALAVFLRQKFQIKW